MGWPELDQRHSHRGATAIVLETRPDAVNDHDVNAVGPRMSDGFQAKCSRGVLQTIPPTFAAYHQPGTGTNIYDPVANTAAAMNYVMKRYGVLRDGSNLASSVCQFNENCGPAGY
jgi:SLT domain-containing protein